MAKQKLITKEVEKALLATPLYSTDGKNIAPVLVKFFWPYGAGSWYVLEAKKQEDGDWLFFGLVDLQEKELGYFTFSELQSIKFRGNPRLGIERDMYFDGQVVNKETNEVLPASKVANAQ